MCPFLCINAFSLGGAAHPFPVSQLLFPLPLLHQNIICNPKRGTVLPSGLVFASTVRLFFVSAVCSFVSRKVLLLLLFFRCYLPFFVVMCLRCKGVCTRNVTFIAVLCLSFYEDIHDAILENEHPTVSWVGLSVCADVVLLKSAFVLLCCILREYLKKRKIRQVPRLLSETANAKAKQPKTGCPK